MKIVFDVDGVVRKLMKTLEDKYHFKAREWNWKLPTGEDFWVLAKRHPEIFEEAPPTEYYNIIKKYVKHPEFYTCQREEYKEPTFKWLIKHFGTKIRVRYYKDSESKFKAILKRKNTILIEDYPGFKDYSKIYLIPRLYNRHVKCANRLNRKSLRELLIKYGGN